MFGVIEAVLDEISADSTGVVSDFRGEVGESSALPLFNDPDVVGNCRSDEEEMK